MTAETTGYGVELGKSYRIYGKMGDMKRFKPVCKDHFVANLIYADIYTIDSQEKKSAIERDLAFMNEQGTFEVREVHGHNA